LGGFAFFFETLILGATSPFHFGGQLRFGS
jgi:hypothetical protein